MIQCPNCSLEIADGAVVCKHCKETIGTPPRPTGVTVIAVILFAFGFYGLVGFFSIKGFNSFIFGIKVSDYISILNNFTYAVLSIYCGYGFLKLQYMARKTYICWTYYGIINGFFNLLAVDKIIQEIPKHPSENIAAAAKVISIISSIIMLGLSIYILYYLNKKKDYFVN